MSQTQSFIRPRIMKRSFSYSFSDNRLRPPAPRPPDPLRTASSNNNLPRILKRSFSYSYSDNRLRPAPRPPDPLRTASSNNNLPRILKRSFSYSYSDNRLRPAPRPPDSLRTASNNNNLDQRDRSHAIMSQTQSLIRPRIMKRSFSFSYSDNRPRPPAPRPPDPLRTASSNNNLLELEQRGLLSPASSVSSFVSDDRDDVFIHVGESGRAIQATDNSPDKCGDRVMQHFAVPALPQGDQLVTIPELHVTVYPRSPSVTTLSDVKFDTVSVNEMVTLNSQRTEPNDTIPNLAVEPTSPVSLISSEPYSRPMPCASEMNSSDSIVI